MQEVSDLNTLNLEVVQLKIPENTNIIIGQSHFIKTVEDIYETMVEAGPNILFGVAFCEASGSRLIRSDGNKKELEIASIEIASQIGAGHSFVILLKNAFPINVLNRIKNISEVCRIYVATANPTQAIIAETKQGRAILGFVDGQSPLGIEDADEKIKRKKFLRDIGYKK